MRARGGEFARWRGMNPLLALAGFEGFTARLLVFQFLWLFFLCFYGVLKG